MTIYQPRPTLITLKTSIVLLILLGATSPMAGNFPATGQTSCYSFTGILIPCENTGQDGEIQAGKTLKYKDDGKKGTITDLNTLLVWEKRAVTTVFMTRTKLTLGKKLSIFMLLL